jgi:hypothetical protein
MSERFFQITSKNGEVQPLVGKIAETYFQQTKRTNLSQTLGESINIK